MLPGVAAGQVVRDGSIGDAEAPIAPGTDPPDFFHFLIPPGHFQMLDGGGDGDFYYLGADGVPTSGGDADFGIGSTGW